MPGSPFWAVLFYSMLLVLGLDTMIRNVETTVMSIYGLFPVLRKIRYERYLVVTVVCTIYFLLDIPLTLNSGTFWIGKFLFE